MQLSEYWIGDAVLIISSNQRGRFEGIDSNGRAIVRIPDQLLAIDENDLQPLDEVEEEVRLKLIEENHPGVFSPLKSNEFIGHVIDLHYEKLAPEKLRNPHPHIIEFQLEKCREFIEMAIQKKFPFIRIIHGRGQGKLKAAVEQLLKDYAEVNLVSSTPDSGALEIWMR